MQNSINIFDEGTIVSLTHTMNAAQLPWNPHPKCKGVSLKHLVTSEATQGALSCHLVRIEVGCEISEHVHPGNLELHEVLSGNGRGVLGQKEISYSAGISVVIPADLPHKVLADQETVYMLAKFTPALL